MTRLEIVNAALIKAGQKIVTAVTETKASRLCNAQYPLSVDVVFAAHPWDELKKQTSLVHDEHFTPEFGFTYAFDLPTDFIRLIEEEPKGFDYDRAAGRFFANETPFIFSYVALPTTSDTNDVPDWDEVPNWNDLPGGTVALDTLDISGQLTDVLTYHILSRCSYGITGDHNDTQIFESLYTKALSKATSTSAQQKPDMYIRPSIGSGDNWVEARG